MGGKALSVPSIRLSLDNYREAEQYVVKLFKSNGICVHTIKQISTKESFGDLDIVVDTTTDRNTIEDIIKSVSTELVKNSDVWSFGLNGFQVDVVFSKCPAYTAEWMSFSDASNLVGRIAHKLGLKHGHDGLHLPVRADKDTMLGIILLTRDIDVVHTLLDLNPTKWHTGFKDTTEIYEWVSASALYNPDIYLLDNRNAKARQRDAKRPTYTGMLNWIREQPSKQFHQFNKDKSVYLPMIFEKFPHAVSEYENLQSIHAYNVSVKEAWNEKLPTSFVMSDTQYTHRELGDFIQHLKSNFSDDEMLTGSHSEILLKYQTLKKGYQCQNTAQTTGQ